MAALIAQIAHLADAERAGAHHPQLTEVAALTDEVFARIRVIPDQQWVLTEVARGDVMLDPARITQAWLQLADNAAKHCAPGTRIEIGSAMRADTVEFWVRDHGPGIDHDARQRIFERFGRADASRGTEGSGPGLSIVQALAAAHGGRVELTSDLGQGSRFVLIVPVGSAHSPCDSTLDKEDP